MNKCQEKVKVKRVCHGKVERYRDQNCELWFGLFGLQIDNIDFKDVN